MSRPVDTDKAIRRLVPINRLSTVGQDAVIAASESFPAQEGQIIFTQGHKDAYVHYLLDGQVSLLWNGKPVRRLGSDAKAAARALDPPGRKRHTVRALTNCTLVRIQRVELARQLELVQLNGVPKELEVSEIATEKSSNWMIRMLQSKLFSALPATNIQAIFGRLEEISVAEDQVVVRQGEPGDYYYVIEQGYCEVSREISHGRQPIHLADLGPGDAFGEAALISGDVRNASVTMLSEGRLMRLSKDDFDELIRRPLLHEIEIAAALELIDAGGEWIDIRYPEEYAVCALVGSRNIPLNILRIQANKLSPELAYIVCSDDIALSAVGAFLLVERGFDVRYLSEPVSDVVARNPSLRNKEEPAHPPASKVIEFPSGSSPAAEPKGQEPGEVHGMVDDRDRSSRLENTIDRIDKLYTDKEWSEATRPPVPVEDYAETATGKSLADLIEEMDEDREALRAARTGVATAEKTAPPYAPETVVDLDPTVAEFLDDPPRDERSSVLFVDTRTPLDIGPVADRKLDSPEEEIAKIMADFEDRIRAYVETAASRRAMEVERRYRDKIDRIRQTAKAQIHDREITLRRSYEASFKKKEQTLRNHYKKLMKLANQISEQKAQVQQARRQFEEKLNAANELYKQVEDMRRLLRDHLGGLGDRIGRDMGRLSAS